MSPKKSEALRSLAGGENDRIWKSHRLLGVACALILCVILIAGLWPFHAPKNGVVWLKGENGLQFGRNGIVASSNRFGALAFDGACTLELQLEPERTDGAGTILAFDNALTPRSFFALRQFGSSLAIQRGSVVEHGRVVRPWLRTDRVLEKGKSVVITITGGPNRTAVYVNSVLVNASSAFGLQSGDLTGRLVLGNSIINDSWQGKITGLAIYDDELTPSQVETHFERWTRGELPVASEGKSPVALYMFDERAGSVVHDRINPEDDLVIRARYYVLHPPLLASAWDRCCVRWNAWRSWSYWSDVCVNISGFMPFGFFFTAYLSALRKVPRPRATVAMLGLAISLAIEIAQHFLPTRDSSTTDVLTNTLGTMFGAALYRPTFIRKLLRSPHASELRQWLQRSSLSRGQPG